MIQRWGKINTGRVHTDGKRIDAFDADEVAALERELDDTRAAVELLAKQVAAAGPGHVGCRLCGYHTSDGWCCVDMRYQCERQIKAWAMEQAKREQEEANASRNASEDEERYGDNCSG